MSETRKEVGRKAEIDAMPWFVAAGSPSDPEWDGLKRDCVLVACMQGEEIVSVSLHVLFEPAKE